MKPFLRVFFKLLYHQFAFAYDLVAATVSFNRWKDWINETLPLIHGTRILELGHGPGHLQRILLNRGLVAVAIDESSQMGRLAQRNTQGSARLTRGLAQHLPFTDSSFETAIATFPSEYIFDPSTLAEVKRCLSDGGRLIVLPVAVPKNPLLGWLFKVTGEAPSESLTLVEQKLRQPFEQAGFSVETHIRETLSGTLLMIVSTKIEKETK